MLGLANKITMRLRPFCDATGLGPSKVYDLITAAEIESFTAGKARLIVVQSYFDYIKRQQQNARPIPSPNPRAGSREPPVVARQQTELPRRRGRPRKNAGAATPQQQVDESHDRGRPPKGAPPLTSPHPISRRATR